MLQEVGRVIALQIQREPLKEQREKDRLYLPQGKLAPCEAITLTLKGITAFYNGVETLDVHHVDHPRTRNTVKNPISFGLTGNYQKMRAEFGEHMIFGIAGENILVESDLLLTEETIEQVIFRATDGREAVLENVIVALPCEPFTTFCLGGGEIPAPKMKSTLQFLSNGVRGFYCTSASDAPQTIQLGDTMFLKLKS